MPFGDLLRPIFSAEGEIKGVEFDPELSPLMFKEHGSKPLVIQRAIKACAYINWLLAEGQSEDFLLTTVSDPEIFAPPKKQDANIQVDAAQIKANVLSIEEIF